MHQYISGSGGGVVVLVVAPAVKMVVFEIIGYYYEWITIHKIFYGIL
jgi:hypothetical protein